MRKVLESKNESSSVADWAILLVNYGIEFEPITTIKAQALTNFIAEMTSSMEEIPSEESCKLYFDGS